MQLLRRKDVDMLHGNIVKGIVALTLPIMVMNVLASVFNIIDMTMLKTYGMPGENAVGAVGVCGSLISLITALVTGCSTGTNVAVAKRIGSGNREGVKRAVGTSVLFSAAGGLLLAFVGIVFARTFLTWVNCSDSLIDDAVTYFRLYFAAVPIQMVYSFSVAILRSAGDSSRPMIYSISGGLFKVVLNYVFVAHTPMKGVVAVALATILSWGLCAFLSVRAVLTNKNDARLELRRLRVYGEELSDVLRVGIPTGLQMALYSVANVVITSTVNSYGAEATTGISIANTFDGILYQICHATSLAVLPYVSQNIGARNVARAKKSIMRGILITAAIGGFFGALSASFSAQLSSLMTDSEAVIAYSREKMIIISSTYFLCGINDIMGAAMRGMGKPMLATVTTLVYMCGLRFVWVYAFFPLCPNFTFLYLVWPVGWVLSLITILFFYFPRARRLAREFHNPA